MSQFYDKAWYISYGDGSTTGYYAVPVWQASHTYAIGSLIRPLTAPSFTNERCYVAVPTLAASSGSSGSSEPNWSTALNRGGGVLDSQISWYECTGMAAFNGDSVNTPSWAQLRAYLTAIGDSSISQGVVVKDAAATHYFISVAGTIGSSEPTWNTSAGAQTTDNSVTWSCLGLISSFSATWAAPHARLLNATPNGYAGNQGWGQPGNLYFIADNSAEICADGGGETISVPGFYGSMTYILSVDHTASVPPGPSALLAGASIKITSNANFGIQDASNDFGRLYVFGLSMIATGIGGGGNLNIGGGNDGFMLDGCALILLGDGFISMPSNVSDNFVLNNTTTSFAFSSSSIVFDGNFTWRNTLNAIQGTAVPAYLFGFGPGVVTVEGVDLSGLTTTLVAPEGNSDVGLYYFKDCKFAAGVVVYPVPQSGEGQYQIVYVIRSDSGSTNYRNEKYSFWGVETTNTSITRVGGATDGTNVQSRQIATTAYPKWVDPFISLPLAIWNDTVGVSKTLTVYGTINAGSVPNNDDIWIEVEYLGSGSTPIGSFSSNTKATLLSTGSALTSDGSTWNDGGSGAGWSPFSMSVTFTPQMKGVIYITVRVAKPSVTFYIDPQVSLV